MFNSLSNKKILDQSKLKAFADDKINAIEKLNLVLGWVKNIVVASIFSTMLLKRFFHRVIKSGDCVVSVNSYSTE